MKLIIGVEKFLDLAQSTVLCKSIIMFHHAALILYVTQVESMRMLILTTVNCAKRR